RLRTIATLEQEPTPLLRLGDQRLQLLDLPGGDEWRQRAQLREDALQVRGIVVRDGLGYGLRTPRFGRPRRALAAVRIGQARRHGWTRSRFAQPSVKRLIDLVEVAES